jgi:hypothetical protein
MTELTLKLIIILIPGAIATIIFGKLILHKDWTNFQFILFSTLFGMFSYVSLQGGIEIINLFREVAISDLSIWKTLTNTKAIPYGEVFKSSLVAISLAFIISFVENKKWINSIAKITRISNKYGEENLFSRYLNDPETEYVYLRDIKNNLTYHGWVKSFSEDANISEIRLAEVSVYKYENSELLYEIKEIYLSFSKTDIIIEKAIDVES